MDQIKVTNLCKNYITEMGEKFSALNNISLHLQANEFVSLIGESGSGKSTLARMLIGLEKPNSGTIQIDGTDITHLNYHAWRSIRRDIQAVFQDASGTLNPMRSVYQNIEGALLNLTSLDKKQRKSRILELMEHTNMDICLFEVPVRQLSGGEQRRCSLIRALSVRPKYLVLDEVLSGLDLLSADAVITLLERYQSEYHCSCLFITHDKRSAYRLSDRILMMEHGVLTQEGTCFNRLQ